MDELEWSVTSHIHRFADGSISWYVSFSDGLKADLYDESDSAAHMTQAVHSVTVATAEAYRTLMAHRALGAWQRDRR